MDTNKVNQKYPTEKVWTRNITDEDGDNHIFNTIELPLSDYIKLIENEAYQDGFSDGMTKAIELMRGNGQ